MSQIAVVDDHPLFLTAISQLAERSRDRPRVHTYLDFESLQRALADSARFHAVILDLDLGGRGGLHGLLTLKYEYPAMPVIIASGWDDPTIVQRALLLGADSFISKSLALPDMVAALSESLLGERVYPEGVSLADADLAAANRPARILSKLPPSRQRIALGAIIGLQNKVVAFDLGISEGTVRNQMTVVLDSFGLHRRTELQSAFQTLLELKEVDLLDDIPDNPTETAEIDLLAGMTTIKPQRQ